MLDVFTKYAQVKHLKGKKKVKQFSIFLSQ